MTVITIFRSRAQFAGSIVAQNHGSKKLPRMTVSATNFASVQVSLTLAKCEAFMEPLLSFYGLVPILPRHQVFRKFIKLTGTMCWAIESIDVRWCILNWLLPASWGIDGNEESNGSQKLPFRSKPHFDIDHILPFFLSKSLRLWRYTHIGSQPGLKLMQYLHHRKLRFMKVILYILLWFYLF